MLFGVGGWLFSFFSFLLLLFISPVWFFFFFFYPNFSYKDWSCKVSRKQELTAATAAALRRPPTLSNSSTFATFSFLSLTSRSNSSKIQNRPNNNNKRVWPTLYTTTTIYTPYILCIRYLMLASARNSKSHFFDGFIYLFRSVSIVVSLSHCCSCCCLCPCVHVRLNDTSRIYIYNNSYIYHYIAL